MWKHIVAGLFLSVSTLAIGCVTDPDDLDSPDDPTEEVGEAQQALLVSCPQNIECGDACDACDLVWGGKCIASTGECFCKPHLPLAPGAAVSGSCYIDWGASTLPTGYEPYGEWVCDVTY